MVDHACAQGLTLIARIDFVPEWARPADTTFRYLAPEHYGDYARFVAKFAERYAGRVHHIVIWNEPNLAFEWGYRPDPAGYADAAAQAYAAIKEVTPETAGAGGRAWPPPWRRRAASGAWMISSICSACTRRARGAGSMGWPSMPMG